MVRQNIRLGLGIIAILMINFLSLGAYLFFYKTFLTENTWADVLVFPKLEPLNYSFATMFPFKAITSIISIEAIRNT